MKDFDELWAAIDASENVADGAVHLKLHQEARRLSSLSVDNRHNFLYAAGYILYKHPDGRSNVRIRRMAEKAFLESLMHRPGYTPSLFYICFMKVQKKNYIAALEVIYSMGSSSYDITVGGLFAEKLHELKIYCLMKCRYMVEALEELRWLKQKKKENNEVGIDFTGLMELRDEMTPPEGCVEKEIVSIIDYIVDIHPE